jgi:4-hydroxy-tetrahydrodipicolinate synthase
MASSTTRAGLTGLIPPIPTPLRDGRLDEESLRRMIDRLGPHVDGVLYGGSISETTSLSVEERIATIRLTASLLGPDHELAVSIADNSIVNTRRLAEAATDAGASLLVLSSPNYYTNDRRMVLEYFATVGDEVEVDLCLYDNPDTTHTSISVDEIAELAQTVPRLTHVKVTDPALGKVAALRQRTELTVVSGDDGVLWDQLTGGAHAAMVASPLVLPEATRAVWDALVAGESGEAFERYAALARFQHVGLSQPDYPAMIKAVMHRQGVLASPEVRPPLLLPAAARLDDAMKAL